MRTILIATAAAAALVLGSVGPADAAAKKSYKVSVKTSKSTSTPGASVKISGKVSGPKVKGKSVKIQRQYVGGGWKTVATTKLSSKGTYSAWVETPLGGSTSFRVLKARSSVRKAGTSAIKTLPVYKWINLVEAAAQSSASAQYYGNVPVTIEGQTFRHSALLNTNLTTAYNTANLCTTLRATVGQDDASTVADTFNIFVGHLGPGPGAFNQPVNQASVTPLVRNISGVSILILGANDLAAGSLAAIGTPQVLCNADELPDLRRETYPL
ncbi:MAG: hypothetical protein ABWX74_11545 [Aeromicrobium sp.]